MQQPTLATLLLTNRVNNSNTPRVSSVKANKNTVQKMLLVLATRLVVFWLTVRNKSKDILTLTNLCAQPIGILAYRLIKLVRYSHISWPCECIAIVPTWTLLKIHHFTVTVCQPIKEHSTNTLDRTATLLSSGFTDDRCLYCV